MAYTKITVESGEVIESSWGNHIQTQYDEAVAYADGLDKNDIGLGNVLNEEQATKSAFDTHTGNGDIHFLKEDVTKSDVGLENVLNKEQLGATETAVNSSQLEGNTTEQVRSGTTKSDVGLGDVDNLSASDIRSGTTKFDVDLGNVLNKEQLGVDEKASDSALWDGYEIQKDGTDGTGIINFKTE